MTTRKAKSDITISRSSVQWRMTIPRSRNRFHSMDFVLLRHLGSEGKKREFAGKQRRAAPRIKEIREY